MAEKLPSGSLSCVISELIVETDLALLSYE